MAKETKVEKLFNKYLTKMSSLLTSEDARELLNGLSTGNNQYMRIDRIESSAFDSSWIDEIEPSRKVFRTRFFIDFYLSMI